jgi:taurine dioxygenase
MMADTAKAYDDLPDDVKTRIDNLEFKASLRSNPMRQTGPGAFWKTARPATEEEDPEFFKVGGRAIQDDLYPPVVHPAVITHPESRRKCLFLSPTYVDCFLGLEPGESDELHRYLADHMTNGKYVYKHRWAADEALVWDNRRVLHAACGNPIDEFRHGHRTTLADPMRTGRYFDQNETARNLERLVD